MTVYIVTKLAQETAADGTILRVDALSHGVYSSLDMATAIAAKYGGVVDALVVDADARSVLQAWENPGFASA